MHVGLLQPCAGDSLAPAFRDAGTEAEALGAELRAAHAAAVLGEVVGALARRRAGGGVRTQIGEQAVEAALLEIVAAGAAQASRLVGVSRKSALAMSQRCSLACQRSTTGRVSG